MNTSNIRPAAVAGRFYPADRMELTHEINLHINGSGLQPSPKVTSIISPHAGTRFSGKTAGYSFARIKGRQPDRVVVIGCSHHVPIHHLSVWPEGAYEIPTATFPIDEAFVSKLIDEFGTESKDAHLPEHSLELQLPFLERAVGPVPIVPIIVGSPASSWHRELGAWLAKELDPGDLVVCSTDLSHFLNEQQANAIDQRSLDAVVAGDIDEFDRGIAEKRYSMCGAAAVSVAMACAKARDAEERKLLDYRTSAAETGDTARVVGYGAISMERAA